MNQALTDDPIVSEMLDKKHLSREEERDRFCGRELSHDDRMELVTINAKWAYTMAKRYRRGPEVSPDDFCATLNGMVKAAMSFDPERGVRFASWSNQYMINEIVSQRNGLDFPCVLKPDCKQARTRLAPMVEEIRGTDLRWSATPSGIARELGIREKDAAAALMVAGKHFSIDGLEEPSRHHEIGQYEDFSDVDNMDMVEKAMSVLTKIERECVDLYFGISSDSGGIDLTEIAALKGKSKQGVGQTIQRAIRKMQSCRAVHEYRRVAR